MLPIAGQTAGLIGVKFFVDTHGWFPPPRHGLKMFLTFFFHGPSAIYTQEGNRKNVNF